VTVAWEWKFLSIIFAVLCWSRICGCRGWGSSCGWCCCGGGGWSCGGGWDGCGGHCCGGGGDSRGWSPWNGGVGWFSTGHIAGARRSFAFVHAGFSVGVEYKVIRPTFINARLQGAIFRELKTSIVGMTIAGNSKVVRHRAPGVGISGIDDRTIKIIDGLSLWIHLTYDEIVSLHDVIK